MSGLRCLPQPFRDWLVDQQLASLAPRVGEIYTDVVRVCLNRLKMDNGRSFQETFFQKVVKKMDLCMA